jgi:ABC transporter substrate binding protein
MPMLAVGALKGSFPQATLNHRSPYLLARRRRPGGGPGLRSIAAGRNDTLTTQNGIRVTCRTGVKLHLFDVDPATSGYEALFDSVGRMGVDALLLPSSPKFTQDRKSIIALAAKHRIPAIYEWSYFATEGGLMAYSPSWAEMDRQAANYVDKIFRGEKPGDLPIQQPTSSNS